jgi:hypothetical protein
VINAFIIPIGCNLNRGVLGLDLGLIDGGAQLLGENIRRFKSQIQANLVPNSAKLTTTQVWNFAPFTYERNLL